MPKHILLHLIHFLGFFVASDKRKRRGRDDGLSNQITFHCLLFC